MSSLMEEDAVIPRVLMVRPGCDFDGPDLEDVEPVIADDGDSALAMLRRERFDALIVDLGLAPLDSWCVLAAVGNWAERPRLVAVVTEADHVGRAIVLGADLCVMAGTQLHARALSRSTKETKCPQNLPTSFRRPTPSGVSA
jgi:DNA-binding NarL/FixJ family response regulator